MTIEKIKQLLESNEYKECEPINVTKRGIYDFAARVGAYCEKKRGEYFDLFDLISELGGSVHSVDLSDWKNLSGTILIHAKNSFDIILPEYTSPIRDKFTLAHELGHYFLHSNDWKEKLKAARRDSDRAEWEANWFAAGFLMPTEKVKNVLKEENTHFAIAYNFGVSLEAAKYRKQTIEQDDF